MTQGSEWNSFGKKMGWFLPVFESTVRSSVLSNHNNMNHAVWCTLKIHVQVMLQMKIPSGKHTKNYGKSPFIVSCPMNSMVELSIFFCMFTRPGTIQNPWTFWRKKHRVTSPWDAARRMRWLVPSWKAAVWSCGKRVPWRWSIDGWEVRGYPLVMSK